ncbi:hypothetical protein CC78DRAFT_581598 [Lojkania enalia]|uniref:Uncharacterized protein n=1 Tax=Lojkania enalia TaxID=147567 RepID=A0A9P4K651_9PLEO|nr:hypothetical protein CC78DRAFT_581598 [Didymosphaeria enalia]
MAMMKNKRGKSLTRGRKDNTPYRYCEIACVFSIPDNPVVWQACMPEDLWADDRPLKGKFEPRIKLITVIDRVNDQCAAFKIFPDPEGPMTVTRLVSGDLMWKHRATLHRHNDADPSGYKICAYAPLPSRAGKSKMPVPVHSSEKSSASQPRTTSSTTANTAREVPNPSTQSVTSANQQQKTEAELEAERLYEERIEEEYAKREGGA